MSDSQPERRNAEETDEYIKIWGDEGELKAAFFSNEAILLEDIPIEDCNSDNWEDLQEELDNAFPAHDIALGAGLEEVEN